MLRLDMHMIAGVLQYVAVASFAEAWIEKATVNEHNQRYVVASFAEAWIENKNRCTIWNLIRSPPSRRRGLKNT